MLAIVSVRSVRSRMYWEGQFRASAVLCRYFRSLSTLGERNGTAGPVIYGEFSQSVAAGRGCALFALACSWDLGLCSGGGRVIKSAGLDVVLVHVSPTAGFGYGERAKKEEEKKRNS